MLQVDNTDTTNQLLALSVSTQLRTAGSIITDTLNKTLTSLADAASTSFSPSTATRWINILFFLSLVFSLAAALFSILAKQWIREYIKWNSPLALPRENVLVRQIRIEAWEDWQVSMILSSIPILLELGMVLFLVGVIILLWTLDDIVAIVVTVFISLFLAAFAAFTVLPIFSKRCPYRSPTAWACLAIASATKTPLKYVSLSFAFFLLFVRTLVANTVSLVRVRGGIRSGSASSTGSSNSSFAGSLHSGHRRRVWDFTNCAEFWNGRISVIQSPSFASWRVLDRESIHITKIRAGGRWTKPTDLHAAARLELSCERVSLKANGEFAEDPDADDVPEDAAKALLSDIAESSHLIRALAWVQQSSQSTRVAEYIDQSTADIHRDLSPPAAAERDFRNVIRMVTNWCALSIATDTNRGAPYLAILPDSHGAETHADVSRATALRQRSGVYRKENDIYIGAITAMPIKHLQGAAVLARILMNEVRYFGAILPFSSTYRDPLRPQRRYLELSSTLLSLSEYWTRSFVLPEALEVLLLEAPPEGIVNSDVSRARLQYISTLFGTAKVQRLEHESGLGKIR